MLKAIILAAVAPVTALVVSLAMSVTPAAAANSGDRPGGQHVAVEVIQGKALKVRGESSHSVT